MKLRQWSNCASVAPILIAFLGACVPLTSASESGDLNQWVAKHVNQDEQLLCKRDENGEYFFVARKGEQAKVGSRLDVTRVRGGNSPKAFVIAWKFQNEKDGHLVTKVPPTTVKERYVKDNNKTYSEQIEYQTLYLKDSEKMRVTIDIKKCQSADCDRQQTKSKDEIQYSVNLCEVPLR